MCCSLLQPFSREALPAWASEAKRQSLPASRSPDSAASCGGAKARASSRTHRIPEYYAQVILRAKQYPTGGPDEDEWMFLALVIQPDGIYLREWDKDCVIPRHRLRRGQGGQRPRRRGQGRGRSNGSWHEPCPRTAPNEARPGFCSRPLRNGRARGARLRDC